MGVRENTGFKLREEGLSSIYNSIIFGFFRKI